MAGRYRDEAQRVFDAACNDAALAALARKLFDGGERVLLLGAPGTGKSTLCRRLGAALSRRGAAPLCVGADPGSPSFGIPGAVCLGEWTDDAWRVIAVEALCSLDAGRFRLPLLACMRRLLACVRARPVLIDGPGVVRGVAGAELLAGMVDAACIDAVVSVSRAPYPALIDHALRALAVPVIEVGVAAGAARPGRAARARARTRLWDAYLDDAPTFELDVRALPILGTPPPLAAPGQWRGRLAAIVEGDGSTVAIGEIVRLDNARLRLRCRAVPQPGHALLVRDAQRVATGMLLSAGAAAAAAVRYAAPPDVMSEASSALGPRPVVRAGAVTAALLNGVLGDPLLHLRFHHRRRSVLFDLGEGGRLPAKTAHQVSDLFLSHAHLDHIAGFLSLVRSRIGEFAALRVYGPAGITEHIRGLLAGILWDRAAARAPRFEVIEFDGGCLKRVVVQGNTTPAAPHVSSCVDGVILQDPAFRVSATHLDHGYGTRVLAFALQTPRTLHVRKDVLARLQLAPGAWLSRLKSAIDGGEPQRLIALPDGREVAAGSLANDLLLEAPGCKLAYATDFADTEANRSALAALGAGAHTLFCEATFRGADLEHAHRTGHLTTQACGQMAARAGVARLVPFHFSRRYENDLAAVYDEIRAEFPRTITPPLRDMGD